MSTSRPRFWKPGTEGPGKDLSEERTAPGEDSQAATVVYNANSSLSVQQQRQRLPIFSLRNHLLFLVENYRTTIIIGETGCGKSTQIPQYLLEAGWAAGGRVIGVTQPRRVAAITLANRVADERNSVIGKEVGYLIRFDDCRDATETRCTFMTDGMLVREMMQDPLLSKYSVLLLDEVHERSLNTDIALGLLKKIMRKRDDLRVVVASATLDAERFHKFFNTNTSGDTKKDTAYIMSVSGRMFPVDVHYAEDPVPDYVAASIATVTKLHAGEPDGDVLVFLTGMDEVEAVCRELKSYARNLSKEDKRLRVLPMYGGLPSSEQMRVFERTSGNCRKVVVATNIAETSLTIPGIVYVIDCGFVKLKAFNPDSGIDALVTVPISQASAEQRAGRAGRVRSGKAYRLYPQSEFLQLSMQTPPEIARTDTTSVVLTLKALGVSNIVQFPFLTPPPAANLLCGVELLFALGALDERCELTPDLGIHMAEFPLSPMFAKMLLTSADMDCSVEAVIIAAMMQINNVFITPSNQKIKARRSQRKFAVEEGDHITLLNVYKSFLKHKSDKHWCHEHMLNYKGLSRAVEIHHQLSRLLHRARVSMVSCGDDVDKIRRCIVQGFFANAAQRTYTGAYKTVRDEHELWIHPTSVLADVEVPPRWVVFNEVVHTSREYMRDITVIQPDWLYELAPHYYTFGTVRELTASKYSKLTS